MPVEKVVLREGIPLATVPIPGKVNPVLVVPTNRLVSTTVSVEAGGNEILIKGVNDPLVEDYVREFYFKLMSSAKVSARVELRVNMVSEGVSRLFKYVALTNSIINALAGGLDDDLLEAAAVVDESLNLWHIAPALRFTATHRECPYIWRKGEGVIESDNCLSGISMSPLNSELRVKYVKPFDEDVITKLAGMLTIRAFRLISDGVAGIEELRPIIRASNSLWHLVYGVELESDLNNELKALTGSLKGIVVKYSIIKRDDEG